MQPTRLKVCHMDEPARPDIVPQVGIYRSLQRCLVLKDMTTWWNLVQTLALKFYYWLIPLDEYLKPNFPLPIFALHKQNRMEVIPVLQLPLKLLPLYWV